MNKANKANKTSLYTVFLDQQEVVKIFGNVKTKTYYLYAKMYTTI